MNTIDLIPGSFEVTLNNKVIYSKLETGSFPAFEKVCSYRYRDGFNNCFF